MEGNEIERTENNEIHPTLSVDLPISIANSDKGNGPLGIQSEGERESSEAGDETLEKQDFKETLESGSSTNQDKEKQKSFEEKPKDCNQQQTEVTKRPYEKSKHNNFDNTKQISSRECSQINDDGLGSKPKRPRREAAKVSNHQNTSSSSVSQKNCEEDVEAEWSLDERRKLLDALDIGAGRRQWNAISKQVKTKTILQVKHFTEKLRAEAIGQVPVHLGGEKDDPLQAWIKVCERLRGGEEEIDVKCIPQVMTIAAVEPTSSAQENTSGPNYARIYTFLSSILKGQANIAGLTPVDARVVLELIQSLEVKLMNADLNTQQSFLRDKYTNVTKYLEKEQIIIAMDELHKKIEKEDSNSNEEGEIGSSNCQLLGESTETAVHAQNDERSTSSNTLASGSFNSIRNSHSEIRAVKDDTPMDIQTNKGSVTSEPLLSCFVTVTDSEQEKISNSDEVTENTKTPVDIYMAYKRPEVSECLPSQEATEGADNRKTKNDNQNTSSVQYIQTDDKLETSETLPSSTVMNPDTEQSEKGKPNASKHQSSPNSSKTNEVSDISHSATPASKRTKTKQMTTHHSTDESLTRSKRETRKLKIRRLKKGLEKPKLSALNPVCVPVTMLNIKPKSYQSSLGRK